MARTQKLFGWNGPEEARRAWDQIGHRFPEFKIIGQTEVKRTCAWDNWKAINWDINKSVLVRQEIGDCVSFGAAIDIAAVAAHEIVRLGEFEQFKVPFPPYLYGISRVTPEGGNGRLRSDGSLGSWMADTVVKYGVLRADYEGVPSYSGRTASEWGASRRPWDKFVDEADNHLIKSAARIRSIDKLAEAVMNGYYCTIASNRGYSMQLKNDKGKSWFQGSDNWPHQMSLIAVDTEPDLCFYRRNQWGENAHGSQLDGPAGGGWVHAEGLEREIEDSGTECFAYSLFEGFPSEEKKPRNYFA